MAVISDVHIEQIAKLEALLINEMSLERQKFLTPDYGYKWFGQSDIISLEEKQKRIRLQNVASIKARYQGAESLYMGDYESRYSHDAIYAENMRISSIQNLSDDQQEKVAIVKKYIAAFIRHYNIYTDATSDVIGHDLNQFYTDFGLPAGTVVTRDHVDEALGCSICLCDESNSDRITTCGHYFHDRCIRQWLWQTMTCPMCRADINLSSLSPVRIDSV